MGKDRNLKTHDGQPQTGQLKVCHGPDVCLKDHSVTTEELRNLPELEDFSLHRLKESLGRCFQAVILAKTGCDLILTFAPFPLLLFLKM